MDSNDSNVLQKIEVQSFESMEKVASKIVFKGVILRHKDSTTIRVGELSFSAEHVLNALPEVQDDGWTTR